MAQHDPLTDTKSLRRPSDAKELADAVGGRRFLLGHGVGDVVLGMTLTATTSRSRSHAREPLEGCDRYAC